MKYSWEFDKFDSEIFGFKVAKIKSLEGTNIKGLISDLKKNKIKYATVRIASSNFPLIHLLEGTGFILVDGLISLNLVASNIKVEKVRGEIRRATESDLDSLKKLTNGLFLTGRVINDPFIPILKAKKFYVKWIENCLIRKAADTVFVWDENGKILGYVTLQKKGQITLLGVSPKARGKGIAKKLINASLDTFKKWKVESVVVETQMDNLAALNLYQAVGFKITNSFLTLRWIEDA